MTVFELVESDGDKTGILVDTAKALQTWEEATFWNGNNHISQNGMAATTYRKRPAISSPMRLSISLQRADTTFCIVASGRDLLIMRPLQSQQRRQSGCS